MRPIRILTLATLFPNAQQPNFGIFVERQTSGLSKRDNVDVTVVNPIGIPPWPLNNNGRYANLRELPQHENWRGLNLYRPRFTLLPKIGGPFHPRLIARAILPLIKKLHAENPFDLIDAEFFYPDGPAAMHIAQTLKIPFTIKARGADIHHWGQATCCGGQLLKAADKASGLLAVSHALKNDMAALGINSDKIMVHYTGLDQERFKPRDRTKEKAKLNIDAPLILTVGALIPRKQQALLIQALPQLAGVHLMLVGKGEAEPEYRSLADSLGVSGRVHFAGSIAHDDLPSYFAAADIMALVSKSEGLANAWVEALACGTPIIASNVGGAPELIRSSDAGLIVEQSVDAIVTAATKILKNPPEPKKVAGQVSHFSWDENASQIDGFFRNIIGE